MGVRKKTFSIRQLASSLGFFALTFALARIVGHRIDEAFELLLLGGYCASLGAAIGVLLDQAIKFSALGLAGFTAGGILLLLLAY